MKAAIMQPTFLPWIGYFDLADQVDVFVLLDDVQLTKRSWQVRNRIKTAQGELYLSVPVKKTKSRDELCICEAEINHADKWAAKHLGTLQNAYGKSPFKAEVLDFLNDLYSRENHFLSDFNGSFIREVSQKIGITAQMPNSSTLSGVEGTKDERLVSICKAVGADEYLSPQGSAIYLEAESPGGQLTKAGIPLTYHVFEHPKYPQLHGDFLPYMSTIDLLFNVGFDQALGVIRQGRRKALTYLEFRG